MSDLWEKASQGSVQNEADRAIRRLAQGDKLGYNLEQINEKAKVGIP